VLRAEGKYDESVQRLNTVLEQYPQDRVVLNDLGRVLFLQRKYSEAIAALEKVVAIDPEDLQAHYNLMLCYQGTGQADLSQKEEKLYLRFKADDAAQALTGAYRQTHPEDNNERQAIHEHESVPLSPFTKPTTQRHVTKLNHRPSEKDAHDSSSL
jgi:tetratricopeptide (TPR) repeat protein